MFFIDGCVIIKLESTEKGAKDMKKIFALLAMALLLTVCLLSFAGCDLLFDIADGDDGDGDYGEGEIPKIDNGEDLTEYTPEVGEDVGFADGETLYTSEALDLVTEINGNYKIDRPFTLDKDNPSKRIYRGIYFYAEDFFQVIYYKDITKLGQVYAILSDSTDSQYAECRLSEQGSSYQIDIIESGIYDLILDTETFGIDMVRVGDITTPVYEKIKSCEMKIHVSGSSSSYTEMTLNSDTEDYFLQTSIPRNASIGFTSSSHNANYKTTVAPEISDTLVYWNNADKARIQVHVGGVYNVYFNAKTYVLRMELQNPDTADYFCQVGFNENNILTAKSSATPYLFEYKFTAVYEAGNPYARIIPSFYPQLGMKYSLTLIDEESLVAGDYLEVGYTYRLTVNLKDFTLTVEKIS